MITIIIAPFILTLLYLTIQNKEQKSLNYLLIALLIIGVYFLLKKNDMIENMTNQVSNIYSINSSVVTAPGKWIKLEVDDKMKNIIFQKLGKNYYLIQVYEREGMCPSHLDVLHFSGKDVWQKIKEKVDNNQKIYVNENGKCIFFVINKQINWTELPKDNTLYNELDQVLRSTYGVIVTKIMKGDLSCNKTSQFIEDLNDTNKMKEVIGTHGFFYYNKDQLCHKVELVSNPKNSIYKLKIMNQVVEADKVIDLLKQKFDDCKLNIVEDLKDDITQRIAGLKSKKIERSLLETNSDLSIEEDADNKTLILSIDKNYLRQKIINNLGNTLAGDEPISAEKLTAINCLITKLEFMPIMIQPNNLFSINEQLKQNIKCLVHLQGVTYMFTQEKIIAIPSLAALTEGTAVAPATAATATAATATAATATAATATAATATAATATATEGTATATEGFESTYKGGLSKSSIIEILKLQNAIHHTELSSRYFLLPDKKIIGLKENKLHKYVFEKSEGSKLEIEDIVNPLKEKEEDNDNKKIRFMMMGKDKNYMFYKNSVSIFNKLEKKFTENKSIKDLIGEDLQIAFVGLFNNKYIILTEEDIYYIYNPETDGFSEARFSNINLNIDFRLTEYNASEIRCGMYGAVLGDLVRQKEIESVYRKNILENLTSCIQ